MPLWWLEVQIAHELLVLRPWQPFNITATLGGGTENLMKQVGDNGTQTLWQMLSASTQWQLTLLLLNRLQLVQVVASEKRGSSPNPQGMKFD